MSLQAQIPSVVALVKDRRPAGPMMPGLEAITEAADAGADLDTIRGSVGMRPRPRYSRGAIGTSCKVAPTRFAASRTTAEQGWGNAIKNAIIAADRHNKLTLQGNLERAIGIEPTTFSLGS